MDIQKTIKDAVEKLQKDDKLQESFKKDPVKTLEKLLNIDLPDDQIKLVVDGIKAKLNLDGAKNLLGGLLGKK